MSTSNVDEGPVFQAPFDLDHDEVYHTSIYPTYTFDLPGSVIPPTSSESYAPPAPSSDLLSVPPYPRVRTVSMHSGPSQAGSEPGGSAPKRVSLPQDFFIGGEQHSLLSLYEKYQYRPDKQFVKGIPKPPFPRRDSQPQFKDNLQPGARGIWAVVCWLFAESQVRFCRELLNGAALFISPGNLTTAVFEHCGKNDTFQKLYNLHCTSPMADHLAQPLANTTWNFASTSISVCPVPHRLFRWVRKFITEFMVRFMTGCRYDTAHISTNNPTMGITLLKNSTSDVSNYAEAPCTRSDQARTVYNLIHPALRHSVDDPDAPKDKDVHLAMFRYLSGPTVRKVANSVIGFLGRLNIALCVKSFTPIDAPILLPPTILILAAVFLETEILTVSQQEFHDDGERVSLPDSYYTFSHKERGSFRYMHTIWKMFVTSDPLKHHDLCDDAKQLITDLQKGHNLDRLFKRHRESRDQERTRVRRRNGVWNGIEYLDRSSQGP